MSGETLVAIAGLIVSGIISGLALLFTYRERRASYRQVLYTKQIESLFEFIAAVRAVRKVLAHFVWKKQKVTLKNADELVKAAEKADDAFWRCASILPKELGPFASKVVEACWSFNKAKPDAVETLANLDETFEKLVQQARVTFRITSPYSGNV